MNYRSVLRGKGLALKQADARASVMTNAGRGEGPRRILRTAYLIGLFAAAASNSKQLTLTDAAACGLNCVSAFDRAC
jgi:hypothetical protein